jgi:hypothetical protein
MATELRELTLIVTDLYLTSEVRGLLAASLENNVPLSALELLLARAGRCVTSDWRESACELASLPRAGPVPVAAVSRAAHGRSDRAQWWMATPVYQQAGLSHVQLAEVVALSAEEWLVLAQGFARDFEASGGTLEAGGASEGYWRAERRLVAETADPARLQGLDLHDALPTGVDGAVLRRLMTELQMWLHEHPLNASRNARDLIPVNGLWLWGGGELPQHPPRATLARLLTEDCFMRGLWAIHGASAEALPAGFEPARLYERDAGPAVVAVSLRDLPGASWLERLRSLDRDWLGPALGALRRGAIERLQVHANDSLLTLQRRDLWRIWRRPRSWLEAFA